MGNELVTYLVTFQMNYFYSEKSFAFAYMYYCLISSSYVFQLDFPTLWLTTKPPCNKHFVVLETNQSNNTFDYNLVKHMYYSHIITYSKECECVISSWN